MGTSYTSDSSSPEGSNPPSQAPRTCTWAGKKSTLKTAASSLLASASTSPFLPASHCLILSHRSAPSPSCLAHFTSLISELTAPGTRTTAVIEGRPHLAAAALVRDERAQDSNPELF